MQHRERLLHGRQVGGVGFGERRCHVAPRACPNAVEQCPARRVDAQFGAPAEDQVLLLPLRLKDKIAALVYADAGTGAGGKMDAAALELLAAPTGFSQDVYTLRGDLQLHLGQLHEALGTYSTVIAFDRNNMYAHQQLALCLCRLERWELAAETFRKLLSHDTYSDRAHIGLANRVAQAPGCQNRDAQILLWVRRDRIREQPAPRETAPDAEHRWFEIIDDDRHDARQAWQLHPPKRNAEAVIERQMMRDRGLELMRQRRLLHIVLTEKEVDGIGRAGLNLLKNSGGRRHGEIYNLQFVNLQL